METLDSSMNIDNIINDCNMKLISTPYHLELHASCLVICDSDASIVVNAALLPCNPIEEICQDYTPKPKIYAFSYRNGKYLTPIEVEGELKNTKFIYKNWGMNRFPLLNKKEKKIISVVFSAIALTLQAECVYSFSSGWLNASELLIKNLLISSSEVKKINNSTVKKELCLADMTQKQVYEFIAHRYFPVMKNKVYSITMFIFLILGILYPRFLEESDYVPSFGLYIYGRTGTRKTTSVMAMLNPFREQGASFEDTLASIIALFKGLPLGCFILEDLKEITPEAIAVINRVIRLIGDITTKSNKMSGSKIVSNPISSLCAITGEERLHLQESSMARLLLLEYDSDTIDLFKLEALEKSQSELCTAVIFIIQKFISNTDIIGDIRSKVIDYRSELTAKLQPIEVHGRYITMISWLTVIYEMLHTWMKDSGIEIDFNYAEEIEKFVLEQHYTYKKDPIMIFSKSLFDLLSCNGLSIITEAEFAAGKHADIIDYDSEWFIASGIVYNKIKQYVEREENTLPFSEKALRASLSKKEILKERNGKLTYELRKGGNRCSGYYIRKNLLKGYIKN